MLLVLTANNRYREQVLYYLLRHEVGSFIVRESTTHKGCFTLTVRVSKSDHASGIVNYLIEPSQDGVKIKVSYTGLYSLICVQNPVFVFY